MWHSVRVAEYILILSIGAFLRVSAQDVPSVESKEKALASADDTTKMHLLVELDNACIGTSPAKSLAYEKQRLAIAEKLDDHWSKPAALIAMSRAAIYLNDLGEAKTWLKQALQLAAKRNEKRLMALALINLGAVSQGNTDNTASLDYYLRAVRLTREIRDTPLTVTATGNIGIVYYTEGDYAKAEAYTLEELPLIDSNRGDQQTRAKAMDELGNIYFKENKHDLALRSYESALRIYSRQNNQQGVATIYGHYVSIYENKPDSALFYAFKAREIWDRVNPDNYLAGENFNNIGEMYYVKATDSLAKPAEDKATLLREAEKYTQMGLRISLRTHRAEELIYAYNQLARIEAELNDFKTAYENIAKGAKLNDSLFSQDEKNRIASMEE